MLLLPLTALEGKERTKLYRKYGIELIVLDKRINFMKEKKNVWFNTSWFCSGVCNEKLKFECVGGEDEQKIQRRITRTKNKTNRANKWHIYNS